MGSRLASGLSYSVSGSGSSSGCIFLIMREGEPFFHVFVGYPYIMFGEISIRVFCPFFNWVVGFVAVKLYQLLSREF